MAVQPHIRLEHALVMTFNDTSMPALARGAEVKFNSSDTLLAATSGSDAAAIGIVNQGNGTAGRPVSVVMYGCSAVVPVTVGTGGATRGAFAVRVADGFTDSATIGGGTTVQYIRGQFMQSGVAGDTVGLNIGVNPSSVKA